MSDILNDDEDDGEVEANTKSCGICEELKAAGAQKGLSAELQKQRELFRIKYKKLFAICKRKHTLGENKRVAGDNACTASQRSKDPSEKKK